MTPRRRRCLGTFCAAIAMAALLAAHPPAAAERSLNVPRFRVQELPTLGPTSRWSFAHDINDAGVVSGMAHVPNDLGNRWWAVKWVDGAIQRLRPKADSDLCWGLGINDRGDVSGACRTPDHPAGTAMLWLANGEAVALDSSRAHTFAANVNNAGLAAGHSGEQVTERRAAIWRNATLVLLQRSSGVDETAFDVNDRGDVVGVGRRADGTLIGLLWSNGVPQVFAEHAMGMAINRTGDIAGRSSTSWTDGGTTRTAVVPTVWIGGTRHALMQVDGDMVDINDAGWAVGYHSPDTALGGKAILFDGQAVHDLLSLVDGPSNVTALVEARAINNAGQIVAWGLIGGEARAVLLHPVRP